VSVLFYRERISEEEWEKGGEERKEEGKGEE
jgi:hypothetical protein